MFLRSATYFSPVVGGSHARCWKANHNRRARVFGCSAERHRNAQSTISIRATSFTSGNFLGYIGQGDAGDGLGQGQYQLGTCSYDGVGRTNCLASGSYQELAGSVTPGATGTFAWRMTWLGNIPHPILARSTSLATPDILGLSVVPTGAFFEVLLGNGKYANRDFGAPDTPNPTGGSLNWQAFLTGNATCTGAPPHVRSDKSV